jgi:FixJ family two-component response regulator
MQALVRQLLTNREVNNHLSYSESRTASLGSDCSGGKSEVGKRQDGAELLMAAQPYTIAIVDDDPSMLKALGRLLVESGYCVELFASFPDVLKRIPSSKATCILIDCQLGQFSGIDLARELTASGFMFPIIFMTASDDENVREQALAIGCVAFLRKPFLHNQLLDAVNDAREKQSVQRRGTSAGHL